MTSNIQSALTLIDEAHALDPNKTASGKPYELHYAQRMTHYLDLHTPDASTLLQIAVRAQHFRRWEVPRDSYPRTKPGYFAWRTFLKKRQAEQVKEICLQCGFTEDHASKIAALIAKEDLKKGEGKGDPEAQVLEDCACLVFLVRTTTFSLLVLTSRRSPCCRLLLTYSHHYRMINSIISKRR